MALADLNSIHFYHPPTEASLPRERVSKAPNASGPKVVGRGKSLKAPGPSNGRSALWGDDPIEFIDMTDSPSREHFSPSCEPSPDLKDSEADAGDTFNEIYNTGISNDHDDLPILEELQLNAGEMRKFEQPGFSSEQEWGLLGHAMKEDCGGVTGPNSRRGEDKKKPIVLDDGLPDDHDGQRARRKAGGSVAVVHTSDSFPAGGEDEEKAAVHLGNSTVIHATDGDDTDTGGFTASRKKPKPIFRYPPGLGPEDRDNRARLTRNEPGSPDDPVVVQDQDTDSSGNGASEEPDGNQELLSTLEMSVAGSEAGYLTLHEKSEYDPSNTSPRHRNPLSSTPGKRTCGSKGGNRKDLTPDPSTGGKKKNPCNGHEAEADDKEKHNGNGDTKTTPLLGFTKKRVRSAVEGKSASKHRVKRRCCSPPNQDEAVSSQDTLSAVQDQDLDTQADGTSPESQGVKPEIRNATTPRGPASGLATSPPVLKQVQGQGYATQAEEPEWEIVKILDKRETVSGKEYKVRWKNTWLPKGELGNAPKLLRKFEAKGREQLARKRGRPARTDKVW